MPTDTTMWQNFVGAIYVLTTHETRPTRLPRLEAELTKIGIRMDMVSVIINPRDAVSGMRGCYSAHREAAHAALTAGHEWYAVFEDDVIFSEDAPRALPSVASFLNNGTDGRTLIYLGHLPMAPMHRLSPPTEGYALYSADNSRMLHAYIAHRDVAQWFAYRPFCGIHIDAAITYRGGRSAAVVPMIAFQNANVGTSMTDSKVYVALQYVRNLVTPKMLFKACEVVALSVGFVKKLWQW